MAVEYAASRQYSVAYDLLFKKCQEAVLQSGFALNNYDLSRGQLKAKSTRSWKSWAENITIEVSRDGLVVIRSKSAFRTTLIDYGKNKSNVETVFGKLTELVDHQSYSVNNGVNAEPTGHVQVFQPSQEQDIAESSEEKIDGEGAAKIYGEAEPVSPTTKASPEVKKRKPKPLRMFCSYSHKDHRYLARLKTSLIALERQELIEEWHDRKITPGQQWADLIDDHLEAADIILVLITPDFIASDYAYNKEMKRALIKHQQGEALVVPIIVRPTDWKGAPFERLQALPTEGKPITEWTNRDKAWLDVSQGIRKTVEKLASER